jgi:hypothetical protein
MIIEVLESESDRDEGPGVVSPVFQTVTVGTKKVMLTMPWQKHTNPVTAFSVMGLFDRRRCGRLLNYGDAFVAHTRNTCANLFLGTDLEWMLTIDDDMIVPFGDAKWFNAHTRFNLPPEFAGLNALDRLLSHGKTLVGALYFGRHELGRPMYAEGANIPAEAEFARKAPMNLIKPTKWVGTGCMLVHRSVYLDLEKKFPRLARNGGRGGQWFSTSEHTAMDWIDRARKMLSEGPMTGEKAFKALEMLEKASSDAHANSSLGMGEDVQFCTRAKDAGHQPFVDMGLVCGHIGSCVYGPRNTRRK